MVGQASISLDAAVAVLVSNSVEFYSGASASGRKATGAHGGAGHGAAAAPAGDLVVAASAEGVGVSEAVGPRVVGS